MTGLVVAAVVAVMEIVDEVAAVAVETEIVEEVVETWFAWRWKRAHVNNIVAKNEFCKQMKAYFLLFSLF